MASISVQNMTLRYPIYDASHMSFRRALFTSHIGGTIGPGKGRKLPYVTALEDINLELRDGNRIGLIGHNGAGKTTLLKVLGGIYQPSTGRVEISGEFPALISMGLGLDPDDTGYENIMTCGLYIGMDPLDIRENTEAIAEFTELGEFLHLPVRTYSTGMITRLTFAITTAMAPEIMVMDEGIGAGDARFAQKTKERVDNMINRCSIMVVASHSPSLIQAMCNEAALLAHGRIIARGPVDEILETYDEMNRIEG